MDLALVARRLTALVAGLLVVLAGPLASTAGAVDPAAGYRPAEYPDPERVIRYDVQTRGDTGVPVEDFADHLALTLADYRGWSLGGAVAFRQVAEPGQSEVTLWLAEASTMTSFSPGCSVEFSCRVGRDVVINADRWTQATDVWTLGLDAYQHYVVNHELGHFLGFAEHPPCPGPGRPAPVMTPQSTSLGECRFNVWPLPQDERRVLANREGVTVRPDVFSDITFSVHSAAVRSLEREDVVNGYPDGSFRPDLPVVRGQAAAYLARARDLSPTGRSDFSDIATSTHREAVRAVADAGITRGYPDGTFRPGDVVTRGQMAAFLARALELPVPAEGCDLDDLATSTHRDAVCAVVDAGIAAGYGDGTFGPGDPVTRAQLATFVARGQGWPAR